ncbi:MAG: hypothetical protein AB1486_17040 [Planctomycetota bacterium]
MLAVGIIGAIIARFRPQGMARALFATALAQALVAVIAMILWKQYFEILILSGFFIALWLGFAVSESGACEPRIRHGISTGSTGRRCAPPLMLSVRHT